MDNNTSKLFKNIADTASMAAQEAKTAMQNAGKVVADKYDLAKISLEVSRIKADQDRIFTEIGREVYITSTSTRLLTNGEPAPELNSLIDPMLIAAEQKQQEIDALQDRQAQLNSSNICPACARVCAEADVFCSACGAKL